MASAARRVGKCGPERGLTEGPSDNHARSHCDPHFPTLIACGDLSLPEEGLNVATESSPDPALSGFRLMPLGSFSFDTRVQLARRAQASLDVQYYDFENDETGRWLLKARQATMQALRVGA